MASTNKAAYGTTLGLGQADGPPETYVTIAELRKLTVGTKQAVSDVSNHGSPLRAMEYVASLIDADINIEGNWIGANSITQGFRNTKGLGVDMLAGTVRNFSMTFTDLATASSCTFAALVNSMSVDAAHDGNLKLTGSLKISGGITWSGGAA